jgi:hypothetical protein
MSSKVMLADHNSNDPHFDVELHITFVSYVSMIKMHSQQHLDAIALSTEAVWSMARARSCDLFQTSRMIL